MTSLGALASVKRLAWGTIAAMLVPACAAWPAPAELYAGQGESPEDSHRDENMGTSGSRSSRGSPPTTETSTTTATGAGGSNGVPRTASPRADVAAHRMTREQCRQALRDRGLRVSSPEDFADDAVRDPFWLASDPAGLSIRHRADVELHEIMDCRLVVALAQWAELLVEREVAELRHFSAYRPGARIQASGRPSGHASALAIDISAFILADGRELIVEEAWSDRRRGVDPCGADTPRTGDSDAQTLLRDALCAAVEARLFQVVLTPHHDRAHRNHLHLELRPDADWTYLR